ncbi:MAG: hypothetical protein K0Q58_1596 [Microbacterium sp.]|nr:hypothetical protein [Microbacterium sp.]
MLQLSATTYPGRFVITRSGTAEDPIVLCGTPGTTLEGEGAATTGTVLRLVGADHWRLEDFAVRSAQRGVVLDRASHNELHGLEVSDTGGQGIRLHNASTNNMIVDSIVRDTGVTDRDAGEGIAIGSRESSWCDVSDCEPDRSDGTIVVGTTVDHTAGEAISAEEGTSAGVIRDNWDAAGPGVQVHSFLPDWGLDNRIVANTFGGAAEELAVQVIGVAALAATEVGCDNAMTWGPPARANVECS